MFTRLNKRAEYLSFECHLNFGFEIRFLGRLYYLELPVAATRVWTGRLHRLPDVARCSIPVYGTRDYHYWMFQLVAGLIQLVARASLRKPTIFLRGIAPSICIYFPSFFSF